MELKVWVEGIVRIVCGVNEKTTCQDVVYALAHATGRIGRFTLIERWRNSERLLAPSEQPLKVLLKWGEHSNDVQFILQWAPLDSGGAKGGPAKSEANSALAKNNPNLTSPGSNGTSSKHKSSPFSSNVGNLPSPSEVGSMKRSKENSGVRGVPQSLINPGPSAMDSSSTGSNGKVNSANNSVNGGNNKIWSGEGSDYSFDSDSCSPAKNLKDLNLSSPPPYRDPPNPKGLSHSPVTTGVNSSHKLPPYREPPPPNLLSHQQVQQQQHRLSSGSGSPVVNHQQTTHLINNSGSSSNQSSSPVIGSSNHNTNVSMFDSNVPTQSSRTNESYGSSLNYSSDKPDTVESWKNKDHSITNGDISASSQNGSMPKSTAPLSTSNYQELVRLINLQREKLTSQHAEMTQYDAEIMFWEAHVAEQQRHLDFIVAEIARLEAVSAQQESQVLSLLHLEEESELVKHQSGQLKSEIDELRAEFTNCEQELSLCKNKMGTLTNELHMQHNAMMQRQEEWMQREANTLAEIDRLKKELDVARRETDVVTDLSGTLDSEVSSVEADLAGKRKQMEILINQMKQANLQSLTIQPPDESIDGGTKFFRSTGSGSTRRMIGSLPLPSYPTSKNPHGVWV